MSSSRMISLAEAVSWFAWDQRFTAEDFIAVRLKVNAGELSRYRKNLREGKGPVVSTKDLKIYRHAVADDRKIAKRIEEASGHSYESKAGRKAAKKELDAAFAVIVKAIQDGRDITARGQRDTDNEGGRPIPWKWFDENPEPTVSYEMNVLGHGTSIDIDKNELPNLQDGWTDVELNWDEIERLRGETSAWPLNKRNELAVTDEPSPAPDSKGGTTALPPKKRGGGLKRGPYYGPLKRHLKWRKGEKDDLDTASLKELREDARGRLTTDGVKGMPKTRSGLEEAIKAALRDLGVNR